MTLRRSYELYVLKGDGRIDYVVPVDAQDDAAAAAAAALETCRTAAWTELWNQGRLVECFAPSALAADERQG